MTKEQRSQTIEMLQIAYAMEIESVENYLAAAINLEGAEALPVKQILHGEAEDEMSHARKLGQRIHVLGGQVQGSMQLQKNQRFLQPESEDASLGKVVAGVVAAEEAAILHYRNIASFVEPFDPVTHDLAVELLNDEEEHRRLFVGILKNLDSSNYEFKYPEVEDAAKRLCRTF